MQPLRERLAGRALQADDANFLDVRRLLVVRFDFLGVDVLAVAKDDDVFLASGDVEVAVDVAVLGDRLAEYQPA